MFGTSVAFAQFDTATVLGTVRDANGAVMPSVTINLKNNDTAITATAQTDGDGNFQFTNVKIGNYRISAEKEGFSTAIADKVVITVNARQRVDLAMQPGAVTESVVITEQCRALHPARHPNHLRSELADLPAARTTGEYVVGCGLRWESRSQHDSDS